MGQHSISHFKNDKPPIKHWGRCRCGFFTGQLDSFQAVDDAVYRHEQDVERLKAHLGTRTPSMKSQAAYYREMAGSADATPSERKQWEQLASELERRVGTPPTPEDQPMLTGLG